jgi:sigma-B regulation protein RsbU (phosphoserine phosphatase)
MTSEVSMSSDPQELSPTPSDPAADPGAWFVEELRQALAPVASCSRLALAYDSSAGTQWLTRSEHCSCSTNGNGPPCWITPHPGQPCPPTIQLTGERGVGGTVALCGGIAATALEGAIRRILDHVLHRFELQGDKELLQEELGISWECLEAVYDITANLRVVQNTEELLERIIGKAASIQEGLCIVMWLADEDQLEVVAAKHAAPPEPRPIQGGMLGQAMSSRQSVVVNDRIRLAGIDGLEPELRNAESVAIVPIATRQSLLGALEVWKEGDAHPFDFRLMHLLDTLAILAATVIENDRLHRASLESERMRREIDIGSRIQQTLLVGRPPLEMPSIHAAAITIPSNRIDGDFYDFFEHERALDVIVGDVMGKGIPAALLGAATKNHFLRVMNRLLAGGTARLPQPKEIITLLNPELVKQLVGFESFVTMIYARFDVRRKCLDFIDCGHTKPIHYRKQLGTYQMLQGFNMPLGFSDMDVYEQVTVPFDPGDIFFFYSDGVTEARNEAGVLYGDQRLAQLIAANAQDEPRDLVERVRKTIVEWSESESFVDDLTCVAVKIQEQTAMMQTAHAELDVSSALADLPRVRGFVRHFCQQYFDVAEVEQSLWQLELGLTEATTNVMRHAYKGQGEHAIRVAVDLNGSVIVIRLLHRGAAFTPSDAEVPAIEEPREGQMGRYIMQVYLDSVTYSQDDEGRQCVQLTKDLKPNRQGEA